MPPKKSVGIGLLGLGVVGGGVVKALLDKASVLAHRAGSSLDLRSVLVRDLAKARDVEVPPGILTTDPRNVIAGPAVDVVVEVMGGEDPALDYVRQALSQGKSVVTANKEVIAKYGPELFALATANKAELRFEASVGGGIPIITPLQKDFQANHITNIKAIINGTTNYILTKMAQEGMDFKAALEEAQRLGYAEPDPSNDIDGTDAAYKLAILATLAFHTAVRFKDVHHEGISRLAARDFRYAIELGYAIKLLAIAKDEDGAVQVRVHPVFLHQDELLAKVDGVYNAIQIEGDLVGKVLLYGRGAGPNPTSSAVLADVLEVARRLARGQAAPPMLRLDAGKRIRPMSDLQSRYYIRMQVADQPGVLAAIATVLGNRKISIASVIQKEVYLDAQAAEIVIMTHRASEADVQAALDELQRLSLVNEIGTFVRVED
ncbi:MAG: homoserine dehydrogenase [Chloroflexi bacterium]|nr:homoserine dehydrogenase [Chloroflexota bacterium]